MELSPLEIILIIILVLFFLVGVRVVRGDQKTTEVKYKKSSLEIPERQVEQSVGRGHYLRNAGIVFMLAAILLLLSGMSLFKMVMRTFTWAFIALAIGFAILYLSRKK